MRNNSIQTSQQQGAPLITAVAPKFFFFNVFVCWGEVCYFPVCISGCMCVYVYVCACLSWTIDLASPQQTLNEKSRGGGWQREWWMALKEEGAVRRQKMQLFKCVIFGQCNRLQIRALPVPPVSSVTQFSHSQWRPPLTEGWMGERQGAACGCWGWHTAHDQENTTHKLCRLLQAHMNACIQEM